MEIPGYYELQDNRESNDEDRQSEILPKEDKKYYLIKCLTCGNLVSRTIEIEFLEADEKNKFSFIYYPFLISIKTSKKKNLESANEEQDYFVFKKISCLFCRSKIGKYIISATGNLTNKLEKVKLDNKACGLVEIIEEADKSKLEEEISGIRSILDFHYDNKDLNKIIKKLNKSISLGKETLDNYDAGMNYLIKEYEHFFDVIREVKNRIKTLSEKLGIKFEDSQDEDPIKEKDKMDLCDRNFGSISNKENNKTFENINCITDEEFNINKGKIESESKDRAAIEENYKSSAITKLNALPTKRINEQKDNKMEEDLVNKNKTKIGKFTKKNPYA